MKWNRKRVSNIKPFMNRYNWKGINYPTKRDDWKTLEKNNILEKKKYVQHIFQNITQPVKNK